MSNLVFFSLLGLSTVVGLAALLHLRHARSIEKKTRCGKIAIGSLGSMAIIVAVQLLAEALPVIVTAIAITLFARWLARGASPVVRFFDKQLAKMS